MVVNSRWSFVTPQGFDLVTTLVAFRTGALEARCSAPQALT